MPDVPSDQKMSAIDDAGDEGVTSVEPTAPGPIKSGVPKKSKPFAPIRSLLSHPLIGVAERAYTLLLGGPNQFLQLIR
jgi:hypothetical protein